MSDTQVTRGIRTSDTAGVDVGAGALGGGSGAGDGSGGDAALLTLDDVAAGWPGADGPVVAVEGVSLTLRPGSVVALAGASGVGKTTLLMTAAGLIPPAGAGRVVGAGTYAGGGAGTYVVDGADGSAGRDTGAGGRASGQTGAVMGGDTAANSGGGALFVAEDGHVFDTTVLENLRVARGDVTPDEARAALDAVGLGTWLAALPAGLDTVVGTDAAAVSGGERRRLLVARALLAPARVLLVDEPAEHLDGQTADALVDAVAAHARATGRAVLLATHRLTPLAVADEVLLLAGGGPGALAGVSNGSGTPGAPGAPVRLGTPATVVARGRHEDLLVTDPTYAWAAAQEG